MSKISRRIGFYFVCLIIGISCSSQSLRSPSSTDARRKHYIITVHGVRGNGDTFGDFHSIVKPNLEDIDPSYQAVPINWTYPVGKAVTDKWTHVINTPHQIARIFNEEMFLAERAKIPALGPEDKISIVSYSMGGLMSMTWYYDTMFNFANHPDLKYDTQTHQRLLKFLEKMDNIVGLGPVYWGSVHAELGWSYFQSGNLEEIDNFITKIKGFCALPETQMFVFEMGADPNKSVMDNNTSKPISYKSKRTSEAQNKFEKLWMAGIKYTCLALKVLPPLPKKGSGNFVFEYWKEQAASAIYKSLEFAIPELGNMNPEEFDIMRVTSDAITEMRLARIQHLQTPELNNRFSARWTSVVGVWPCSGKKDSGVTCREFKSVQYERINNGIINIFSGLNRAENDGPVQSPNAVADFLFYTELPGNENQNIRFENFRSTSGDRSAPSLKSKEIYVENMHATILPALEGSGRVGTKAADSIADFDEKWANDVAIMNKECANPKTCEHPNYRHVLSALSNCDSQTKPCNQALLNEFYKVSDISQRMDESDSLKAEMGSFIVTLNIRLPKNYQMTEKITANILKYLKFDYTNPRPWKTEPTSRSNSDWTEHRLDLSSTNYGVQVARSSEIMSSYAIAKMDSDNQILRIYFIGRAWPKNDKDQKARMALESGIPVRFTVALPDLQSRRIVAKIKPTFTTYIDLYMK